MPADLAINRSRVDGRSALMLPPLLVTDGDEVHQSVRGVEIVDLTDIGKARFQAIIARFGFAGQPSAVKDRQQVVRAQGAIRSSHNNIVDVDKAEQFRLDAGFFADLA